MSLSIEDFAVMSADNRMLTLMKVGDKKETDLADFPLFEHAILNDPGTNVKFAALKRIHAYKAHPGMLPMMQQVAATNTKELEPYFSMAMMRLGLMTIEEFKQKLANG